MKKKLIPILLVVMALAFVYLFVKQAGDGELRTLRIGNTTIAVEIADTPEARAQGLSGRPELTAGQGMLFLLGEPAPHTFWMKDMQFPLDIVWIREGRIVEISENVPYPVENQPPASVQSKEPVDAVLEVNADFTEQHGIKIGDQVEWEK